LLDSTVSLLPNLVLAAVIFILFLVVASAAKSGARRPSRKRERQNLGLLPGHLVQATVLVPGFLIALSAVAPSFHASDLSRCSESEALQLDLRFRTSCKISWRAFCS
jgi:small conductance mechanosensitive channel